MITTTMTYEEIVIEVHKDILNICRFATRKFGNGSKCHKEALKHDKVFMFKPVKWKSPRKNNYIILPISISKSETKHSGVLLGTMCYYFDKYNKLNALIPDKDLTYNTFLSSHLFDRYAERILEDSSLGKIEIMEEFLKRNPSLSISSFESSTYENSIFSVNQDGVALGINENGINILKTYISPRMLKGSEIDLTKEHLDRYEDRLRIDFIDNQEEYNYYANIGKMKLPM